MHKRRRVESGFAVQSAMEYLMTYGWAILIIAVILGVLFSLGVFNPVNYAPKVPAGNCHVFRPNGPGTNFNVNLVGTCSGFLPQYVAQFNNQSNSSIQVPYSSSLAFTTEITMSGWYYFNSEPNPPQGTMVMQKGASTFASFGLGPIAGAPGSIEILYTTTGNGYSGWYTTLTPPVSAGQWYFLAATYSSTSGNLYLYVNGKQYGDGTPLSGALVASTNPIYIGSYSVYDTNGSIANIQIYNASLTANEVQYLYNEGIGGAPIYLSHLVGWWPLNGDAKDYSGNGNNGAATNIAFNGSWNSGYSMP